MKITDIVYKKMRLTKNTVLFFIYKKKVQYFCFS